MLSIDIQKAQSGTGWIYPYLSKLHRLNWEGTECIFTLGLGGGHADACTGQARRQGHSHIPPNVAYFPSSPVSSRGTPPTCACSGVGWAKLGHGVVRGGLLHPPPIALLLDPAGVSWAGKGGGAETPPSFACLGMGLGPRGASLCSPAPSTEQLGWQSWHGSQLWLLPPGLIYLGSGG